jgi:hypothetical protein
LTSRPIRATSSEHGPAQSDQGRRAWTTTTWTSTVRAQGPLVGDRGAARAAERGTGAGFTLAGAPLAIETLRRIACDAIIIPVVLGTKSEILEVGRAKRLFAGGLLAAMRLWDKGCTIPGCTIPGCTAPPEWADHIIAWVDGGKTCLLNGALICPRHHTIPRQRGWTATATATEVTWHF